MFIRESDIHGVHGVCTIFADSRDRAGKKIKQGRLFLYLFTKNSNNFSFSITMSRPHFELQFHRAVILPF